MAQIFVSYAHEDKDVAMRLYRDLTNLGFDVWIDAANLLPGQQWKATIRAEIRKSVLFIARAIHNAIPQNERKSVGATDSSTGPRDERLRLFRDFRAALERIRRNQTIVTHLRDKPILSDLVQQMRLFCSLPVIKAAAQIFAACTRINMEIIAHSMKGRYNMPGDNPVDKLASLSRDTLPGLSQELISSFEIAARQELGILSTNDSE